MHCINHEDTNQGDQDDVTIQDNKNSAHWWLQNIDQQEDMDQDDATKFMNDQAQDDAQYQSRRQYSAVIKVIKTM